MAAVIWEAFGRNRSEHFESKQSSFGSDLHCEFHPQQSFLSVLLSYKNTDQNYGILGYNKNTIDIVI